MASLSTAINQILGTPTQTSGARYYSNWSTTSTPGVSAPNALTLDRKVEAEPPLFIDDPTDHYPGVYFETLGAFPSAQLRGQHYDVIFNVRVYYVAKATTNTRPKETAREMAIKLTENILGSDKLGLSFVSSVEWGGLDEDNQVSKYLPLLFQEFYASATRIIVKANVEF